MKKLEYLQIPMYIKGYPNFIDLDWYSPYDLKKWSSNNNGFTPKLIQRKGQEIAIAYNPSLETIEFPQFLYSRANNDELMRTAIFLQRDNKRFVFDLTGDIHRIVFGDQEDTTTRIMTEEEFEAAKEEMLRSLENLEDKDEELEAIATLKYNSDINWSAYIQALTEEHYVRENRIQNDPITAAQLEGRYEKRTYHFLDENVSYETEDNAFKTHMTAPVVHLNDTTGQPDSIRIEKNRKRYTFGLDGTCTVELYGGNLTRQMTQEEFNLRTNEMKTYLLDNKNINQEYKVKMLSYLGAIQTAVDSTNLPTERQVYIKEKK